MKTISVSVSEEDYETFRQVAASERRPIAQLIREAMALYRQQLLKQRPRLTELPVLVGHKPLGSLPARGEIYDDMFSGREGRPDEGVRE